ncbi:MAG: LemA family protein [Pirellulaceae bacterium]
MSNDEKISKKWGWIRALALLGMVAALLGTFFVGNAAYRVFRDNLVVGQVPLAWTVALIPGPTAVQGTAEPEGETLRGPITGQQCLYYRKLVEVETTDSDGDTSWSTVEDSTEAVWMNVVDETGKVTVRPVASMSVVDSARRVSVQTASVQFRARRVRRYTSGSHRYTEWAIRPGDPLFVVGEYQGERIDASLDLPMVISNLGEREYRASKGSNAAYLCIAAVAMATFFVCLLCIVFKWHHVAVYLGLVALLVPFWMFSQWFLLVSTELNFGHRMLDSAAKQIATEPADTLRSALIKQTFNDGVHRYNQYRGKWMNRVVAWLDSLPKMEEQLLSEKEEELIQDHPVRLRPEVSLNNGIGVSLVVLGLVLLISMVRFGFTRLKTKRLIENIPTYPTAGVVIGLTEVKGVAVKDEDWLTSRYAKRKCCWFRYEKKQKQGSGKDAKWVTIASGKRGIPFTLKDDHGTIRIDPDEARVTGRRVFHKQSGNIIRTEWAVNQQDRLYVLGPAGLKKPEDTFLTIRHQEDERYLISVESERTIMLRFAAAGFILLNLSLIGGTTAILALLSLSRFSAFDFFLSALFPPFYLVGLVTAFLYNDLVFLRERRRRSLAMIDVALKKRSDLVPKLVSVVKGYLAHEKEVLESITQMRTSVANSMADRQQAESRHETGARAFLATLEQYPDLKSDRLAVDLQERLITIENEVAFARASYNDSVERYNTRIASVPEIILARIFRFRPASLFRTSDRQAVEVDL